MFVDNDVIIFVVFWMGILMIFDIKKLDCELYLVFYRDYDCL